MPVDLLSQIQQQLFDNYGWDALWLDAIEWEAPAVPAPS